MTYTLVQFHKVPERTGGYDETNPKVGEFLACYSEHDEYEFYEGEDDEGSDVYEYMECISWCDTFEDIERDRRISYSTKQDITYSTLEIEMEEA